MELFARNPDISLKENTHLPPIPIEEDVTSLSAILLNDDYYNFTPQHCNLIDSITGKNIPLMNIILNPAEILC